MKTFLRKISSRKFLAALAGIVTGLAMVFGLDEGVISTVSGAVTTLASVVAYIVSEGRVDAAAVGEAVGKVQDAAESVTNDAESVTNNSESVANDAKGVTRDEGT